MSPCQGCALVGARQNLIHEFEQSLLVLGGHQYFEGYSVLWIKSHVRELHELEPGAYARLMAELYQASRAIAAAFRPWKLNHASLGNQVGHLHFHIIPRYLSDPDHLEEPWLRSERFKDHVPDAARSQALIAKIREALPR